MKTEKAIFVYPITKEIFKKENNDYIKQLITHLRKEFRVINGVTDVGLLDALSKFKKTDIYYFNWIENVPEKRFGFFQVALLVKLLILCKIFNKKVIWFIHNNVSHDKKHYRVKKFITKLMSTFSDLILSHSGEIKLTIPKNKLHIFHHPIEKFQLLEMKQQYKYDLLVWGAISPYKGVTEFVEFVTTSHFLKNQKILIAGKFHSGENYDYVMGKKTDNITVVNKFIDEEELSCLFSDSRYILFTYASSSILSSAALCKSLSFCKEVIAPEIGSFKELGKMKLIHTYSSFPDLEALVKNLQVDENRGIEKSSLYSYIQLTNWDRFSDFIGECISNLYLTNKKTLNQGLKYNSFKNESI